MKKYKYFFRSNQIDLKDMCLEPYDLIIDCIDEGYCRIDDEGTYDINEIKNQINKIQPKRLMISGFNQKEFEYIIPLIKDMVTSLSIFKCPNISNFLRMEELNALVFLNIYWNKKATSLWNINKQLKKLKMTDCNKISDFSGLLNSELVSLELYGSNGLSSFVPKLVINKLDIIFSLNTLEFLGLDMVKTFEDYDFLIGISKMSNLKHLNLPESMFTFEQFAWLKSKMPITEGLDAVYMFKFDDDVTYAVIGKSKPKNLKDKVKADQYQTVYDNLINQFRDYDIPPSIK